MQAFLAEVPAGKPGPGEPGAQPAHSGAGRGSGADRVPIGRRSGQAYPSRGLDSSCVYPRTPSFAKSPGGRASSRPRTAQLLEGGDIFGQLIGSVAM